MQRYMLGPEEFACSCTDLVAFHASNQLGFTVHLLLHLLSLIAAARLIGSVTQCMSAVTQHYSSCINRRVDVTGRTSPLQLTMQTSISQLTPVSACKYPHNGFVKALGLWLTAA